MKINEKIYALRKKHNLSQEELANELNVSRQTVSKWETGESTPDFDKIVPLCEIFDISTEELLRDKKINIEENEDKVDVPKAAMICIAIFLYFVALIAIVIGETVFNLNDGLIVGIFFLICGIATVLIVFACMTRPSKKKEKEEEQNPILKSIIEITSLIFVCIYLAVSFLTMAWHLTWIIWIIYSIVVEIIKLLFRLKEVDNNDK